MAASNGAASNGAEEEKKRRHKKKSKHHDKFVSMIYMKEISEVEGKTFKSSLNICSKACYRKGWERSNASPITSAYKLNMESEPVFVNLLRSPGIDSQPAGPVRNPIVVPAR